MDTFRQLPDELLALLASQMAERRLAVGEPLVEQGGPGDGLFVIIEGRAKGWLIDEAGARRELADFLPDDVVGEMALITGEPRTATVEATEPLLALWLEKAAFNELAFRYPELGMLLTAIMAMRLGEKAVDGLGGKVVGEYRIRRGLGRGGMAVVYEAEPTVGGDTVALKMMSYRLLYERGAMARFQREAEIIAGLDHPNIVRIHEMFPAHRTQFLAMEYCDAPDLAEYIRQHGAWSEPDVKKLAGQLAGALQYMHDDDIVHRDLKPSNVLLTTGGDAKLTDFGLACAPYAAGETPLTEARGLLGTPLYMAPEQTTGDGASRASDIYALGGVIYETLTGRPPVNGTSFNDLFMAKRQLTLPPAEELAGGIGPDLHAFLVSALAPDPVDRTVSLDDVRSWSGPLEINP